MCPKHGTDYLEYKCRYCCSVAVFFCFGTTHFCNACHDDFQRVANLPKTELPQCPVGARYAMALYMVVHHRVQSWVLPGSAQALLKLAQTAQQVGKSVEHHRSRVNPFQLSDQMDHHVES